MDSTWGIFAIIVIYLVGMVAVGIYFMKRNKSTGDYYLGGRKLGPIVTAMSAEASDMSSWLLMGLPGVAYLTGVADAAWTAIGLAVGTYFNWLIVAKRLRRYSVIAGNAITIPEFFSNRYRDKSNILVAVSAVFIVIFFIPYTASGFAACGKLFSTLFDVPYFTAMVVSAVIIVAYTVLGGFSAASTTDLIQSIVMTLALICVVLFGVSTIGGTGLVLEQAGELPGYLSLTSIYSGGGAAEYGAIKIASTFAWGLGYFGMPHILLRFMAIRNEEEIRLSRRIASVWVVISMGVAIFIGIMGYSLSKGGMIETLEGTDSEKLIIEQKWYLWNFDRGADYVRDSGMHHVNGGFPAPGGILQYFRKSVKRCVPSADQRKGIPARGPYNRASDRCAGGNPGRRPEQFCIRDCILCLGRLWCSIRSGHAAGLILEAFQPVRSDRKYAFRRDHDFYMEVYGAPDGRRLGYLRAAPCVSGCHLPECSGKSGNSSAGSKDPGGI